jgi:hypothetical protein
MAKPLCRLRHGQKIQFSAARLPSHEAKHIGLIKRHTANVQQRDAKLLGVASLVAADCAV